MTSCPNLLSDHDRLALQQLAIDYANAIDRRDWDGLDRVFAEDAYIDYSAMGGIAGDYRRIKAWLPRSLRFFKSYQHFVGNFQYRLDGDDGGRARGEVACFNPMVAPGLLFGLPRTVVFGFWYEDEYRRTAAGWRIVRRVERKCYALNVPLWMTLGAWLYRLRSQRSG